MDLFTTLESAIAAQVAEGDLPEYLAESLYAVARNPERYRSREALVKQLLQQVEDFNLYANTGCFKEGCDDIDLEATLKALG